MVSGVAGFGVGCRVVYSLLCKEYGFSLSIKALGSGWLFRFGFR